MQEGVALLMYAIDKDNEGILKALLARGADPNSKNTVSTRIDRVYKSAKEGEGHVSMYCTVDVLLQILI